MDSCRPLNEYAWSVDSIREYRKRDSLETAIDRTLEQMPKSFLIKTYLEEHKAEVKSMLLTEYNEAETLEMFKRDFLAEGRKEGRKEGRIEGRKEGQKEGRVGSLVESVRNLKLRLGFTDQQAKEALNISDEEWGQVAARI